MPLSSVNSVTLTSYKKLEDLPQSIQTGQLKGKDVSTTSPETNALRLAARSENQTSGTLKNKILTGLSEFGKSIEHLFKRLFTSQDPKAPAPATQAPLQDAPLSKEQIAKEFLSVGVAKGFSQLSTLTELSGETLKARHTELASGNGALRTVATGLRAVQQFGSPEHQEKATAIFNQDISGIPFQQWATTGSSASDLVNQASSDALQTASDAFRHLAGEISQLAQDVNQYLSPEPSPNDAKLTTAQTEQFETSQAKQNSAASSRATSPQDPGRKTTLNAVSLLSRAVAPSQQVHLSSDSLNHLQEAISNNDITFSQIKNSAVSFGDLQILRELALSVNPRNTELETAGNLGASINELTSIRPNIGNILASVKEFIEDSNQSWSQLNENNPEQLMDAVARSTFNKQLISEQLNQMPASSKQQAYEQLSGGFGERMRGIIDFAVEKVTLSDYTQDDPVMISTAVKYSTVIDGLIESLNQNLSHNTEQPITKPAYISDISQLSPLEKAALNQVGITTQIIEE